MQYHSSPLPFYLVILKIYIIRYIIYGECQDVTDFLAQLISTPHVADAVYQAFLSQCTSRPAVRASSDFARYFHRWTRDCRRDTCIAPSGSVLDKKMPTPSMGVPGHLAYM